MSKRSEAQLGDHSISHPPPPPLCDLSPNSNAKLTSHDESMDNPYEINLGSPSLWMCDGLIVMVGRSTPD